MPKEELKEVDKEPKSKFRYVCEACTNNAGNTTNPKTSGKITCQSCGKEQVVKPENYIQID